MKDIPESQREFYRDVGRRIAERRAALGLTQGELAPLVGMTRASLSNIERGAQRFLVNTLYDFASALNVTPPELLSDSTSSRTAVTPEDVALLKDLCSRLATGIGQADVQT